MTRYWADGDEYCYPKTNILINKFDIRDSEKLEEMEEIAFMANTVDALEMLEKTPFDDLLALSTLQELHKILFSDIYEWAGEIRTNRISKGDTVFCQPEHTESESSNGFSKINSDGDFLRNQSESFGYINVVHPFRDGNGRTQKWLFSEILRKQGYCINWAKISPSMFLSACIADYNGDRGEQLYHTLSPAITLID